MRMWKVPPEVMCRKHLLGEHVEMHMFAGSIRHGRSIDGHIERGQVEVKHLRTRHDELAEEMRRRGYHHCSPFPDIEIPNLGGEVIEGASLRELHRRCEDCRRLQEAIVVIDDPCLDPTLDPIEQARFVKEWYSRTFPKEIDGKH